MYYLEQKQFKPAMILFGITFIPWIIGLIIANVMFFKIELLILLMIIIVVYLAIILILWKISKRKNHYLLLKKNGLEIAFCDFFNGELKLDLSINQIIEIKYYRITSLKGWLMLFSYILPKCVYITYNMGGEVQTKFIGYMDLNDVKELANKNNINLVIH